MAVPVHQVSQDDRYPGQTVRSESDETANKSCASGMDPEAEGEDLRLMRPRKCAPISPRRHTSQPAVRFASPCTEDCKLQNKIKVLRNARRPQEWRESTQFNEAQELGLGERILFINSF